MRAFGKQLIAETATRATAEEHIREIQELGYDEEIHVNFADFAYKNRTLKPTEDNRIRWLGEILVDYIFLEAARYLTNPGEFYPKICGNCNACCLWPFAPPAFDLKNHPYTQAAFAFRNFGYPVMSERVLQLADSGKYDDIFDKIFLWRTYLKEPFHAYQYGLQIRSISGYHAYRAEEIKWNLSEKRIVKHEMLEYEKCKSIKNEHAKLREQWVTNTERDRKTPVQESTVTHLESLSLADRLLAIAESNYAIDFYPPHMGRASRNRENFANT